MGAITSDILPSIASLILVVFALDSGCLVFGILCDFIQMFSQDHFANIGATVQVKKHGG